MNVIFPLVKMINRRYILLFFSRRTNAIKPYFNYIFYYIRNIVIYKH